jgi:hypothetical protein
LVLLADDLTVIAASGSFCSAFEIDPTTVTGTKLAALGAGEWNVPQLDALLRATFAGAAAIDAYEMDLVREGKDTACLVLNAHKLDYGDAQKPRIVLAVTDTTSAARNALAAQTTATAVWKTTPLPRIARSCAVARA